jgi:hypothetical protein
MGGVDEVHVVMAACKDFCSTICEPQCDTVSSVLCLVYLRSILPAPASRGNHQD